MSGQAMTEAEIATRLDELRAGIGDAEFRAAWQAVCEYGVRVFGAFVNAWHRATVPPLPPFHAQPWAPRRRTRRECRR